MIVSIRLARVGYADQGMRPGDATLFLTDADTGADVLVYAPPAVARALHDAGHAALTVQTYRDAATARTDRQAAAREAT